MAIHDLRGRFRTSQVKNQNVFRRDPQVWSRGLKASVTLVVCLLSIASAGMIAYATVNAQGLAPEWSGPEDISYPLTEGRDLNGALLCDTYQNLHIFWGKGQESGSAIYYRTDKQGSLSSLVDILTIPSPQAVNLSTAVTEHDSFVHLVWADQYTQGGVYYSRAPLSDTANVRAWSSPRLLIAQAESAGLTADEFGTLYLTSAAFEPGGYRAAAYQMRSADSGLTWSEPALVYAITTTEPVFLLATATIDGAGRMHMGIIQRSQQYGVYSEVGYLRSLDAGQTWEPYQIIAEQSEATPNVSNIAPFAFGEDEVHLTWHDPRRMHMWSSDGGVTWSNPVEIISLGAGFGGANHLVKDSVGVLRAVTSVSGGVYVSTFDGSQWPTHERIENRTMDPHGQHMVVCQGNQLHVVYDDRLVADTTVWYAHREIEAPHIERRTIPTPIATFPTGTETSEGSPTSPELEPTTTRPFTPTVVDAEPSRMSEKALTPLLIPTALVIGLVCAVMVWQAMRQR